VGPLWLGIWFARPRAQPVVSYSRVQAREHHWYDTLASSGIAATYGYVLTNTIQKAIRVDTRLSASPHGAFVSFL